jgi:hypothetical protein
MVISSCTYLFILYDDHDAPYGLYMYNSRKYVYTFFNELSESSSFKLGGVWNLSHTSSHFRLWCSSFNLLIPYIS